MSLSRRHVSEDVEHLLRNAELRDEIEPLSDESVVSINFHQMPTPVENEFLASMLAWEQAPMLPISQWFQPELTLPRPEALSELDLHELMWDTIDKLYEKRIVLDFTDHLSDRQLYCLIFRDILPAREKKIDSSRHFIHWDCANTHDDPEIWLRHYASELDRELWAEETGECLPACEEPPYRRDLPRAPL